MADFIVTVDVTVSADTPTEAERAVELALLQNGDIKEVRKAPFPTSQVN